MGFPLLICDDSSTSRKMLRRVLPEKWNVDVTFAANGLEALSAIRAGKVQLVLLDLTMPEMDGYQVLEAMQAEGLSCKVIVISADIQPLARERVHRLGAIEFIRKPMDRNLLTELLTKHGIF